jgi:hypothetical protein
LLDRPVSNSGRLKSLLQSIAAEQGWNWHAELAPDPDRILGATTHIVASADSHVLGVARRWFNLARLAIDARVPDAWIVDLAV